TPKDRALRALGAKAVAYIDGASISRAGAIGSRTDPSHRNRLPRPAAGRHPPISFCDWRDYARIPSRSPTAHAAQAVSTYRTARDCCQHGGDRRGLAGSAFRFRTDFASPFGARRHNDPSVRRRIARGASVGDPRPWWTDRLDSRVRAGARSMAALSETKQYADHH